MIGISIAWVPIVQSMQNAQLYIYIQDVAANLSPPIAAVYIMAVLFKRVNEPGAFWSLLVGLLLGLARMIVNIVYTAPECGLEDSRPWLVRLHYMYYAIFLFWTTVAVCAVVSLFTPAPADYLLIRTTFWSRHSDEERDDEKINLQVDGDTESMRSSASSVVKGKGNASIFTRFFSWFCGINFSGGGGDEAKEAPLGGEGPMVSSIKQSLRDHIILNIMLLIIVCLGAFIFIFFSAVNWTEMITSTNNSTAKFDHP